jgi:hypothetical protein
MSNLVFNIALGKLAWYASLPAANDALVLIALETTGLEADSVLRDKHTFADVVSGSTNEQTSVGRKTLTNVVASVSDATDLLTIRADDVTWSTPSGNPISAFVVCYDPDTTTGTDTDLIPLTKNTGVWNPSDAVPLALSMNPFYQSSSTT